MQFNEWIKLKRKTDAPSKINTVLNRNQDTANSKSAATVAVKSKKSVPSELPKESVPKSVFSAMRRMQSNDTLHADKKGWYIRVAEYLQYRDASL